MFSKGFAFVLFLSSWTVGICKWVINTMYSVSVYLEWRKLGVKLFTLSIEYSINRSSEGLFLLEVILCVSHPWYKKLWAMIMFWNRIYSFISKVVITAIEYNETEKTCFSVVLWKHAHILHFLFWNNTLQLCGSFYSSWWFCISCIIFSSQEIGTYLIRIKIMNIGWRSNLRKVTLR